MLILSVTQLEMQVLQALASMATETSNEWTVDEGVYNAGRQLFGDSWGGREVEGVVTTYCPTISRTFGRLRKKGLLERNDSGWGWGYWRMTSQGRDLIGLPPVQN